MVNHLDVARLLLAAGVRPFVKAGGGDDAAAILDGAAESGFLGHGFGTGNYQVAVEILVLGPIRDKPPLQKVKLVVPSLIADNGHLLFLIYSCPTSDT